MERPASDQDSTPEATQNGPDGADLVTIGLAVFFVSLIAVVGALLILPAIF
jgi:hypothetical protein